VNAPVSTFIANAGAPCCTESTFIFCMLHVNLISNIRDGLCTTVATAQEKHAACRAIVLHFTFPLFSESGSGGLRGDQLIYLLLNLRLENYRSKKYIYIFINNRILPIFILVKPI
jgi:hypothetical protein